MCSSDLISCAGLELLGAGGTYTLNTQDNAVTTIAGSTGTVLFQDNTGFAVGTVNTAGLTTTGDTTFTTTGTVTQTAAVGAATLFLTGAGTYTLGTQNNAVTTLDADNNLLGGNLSFRDDNGGFIVAGINCAGNNVTLSSTAAVTQTGVITAAGLELLGAGGTYTLNTQDNAVTTIAGSTDRKSVV